MSKSIIPINLKDVESNVEGRPLTDSEILIFEESYRNYLKESKETDDNYENTIEEISNLLTINQNNIEEIKEQKWFKRSWKTITGKNKKLERVNQINLVKVQKGSLYFLQSMAERNHATMETVTFAIKRIQDIQIDSIKLKGYLSTIIVKYNSRLNLIEHRLDNHESVLMDLTKKESEIPIYMISMLLLLTAIILFFLTDSVYTKWILSSFLFVLSMTILLNSHLKNRNIQDKKVLKHNYRESSNQDITFNNNINQFGTQNELQIENLQIKKQIDIVLFKYISNYINEDFIKSPFVDYYKKYDYIDKYLIEYSNNTEIDETQKAKILNDIINLELNSYETIISLMNKNVSNYIKFHSNLTSDIVAQYIPESIGLDVLINLDIQIQNQYLNQMENTLEPYSNNIKELLKVRYELIHDYNKFQKLYTESILKTICKGLIHGFTFRLVGNVIEEENFVKSYKINFAEYLNDFEMLLNILDSSIFQLHQRIYDELIKLSISKFQTVWDEFDTQNQSLKPLLEKLKIEIK